MRLRTCMAVAAIIGAAGALALAADLYRRVGMLEHALESHTAASPAAVQVFATVHVIGAAALGVLFLGLALLLLSERPVAALPPAVVALDSVQLHPVCAPSTHSPPDQPVEIVPEIEEPYPLFPNEPPPMTQPLPPKSPGLAEPPKFE